MPLCRKKKLFDRKILINHAGKYCYFNCMLSAFNLLQKGIKERTQSFIKLKKNKNIQSNLLRLLYLQSS